MVNTEAGAAARVAMSRTVSVTTDVTVAIVPVTVGLCRVASGSMTSATQRSPSRRGTSCHSGCHCNLSLYPLWLPLSECRGTSASMTSATPRTPSWWGRSLWGALSAKGAPSRRRAGHQRPMFPLLRYSIAAQYLDTVLFSGPNAKGKSGAPPPHVPLVKVQYRCTVPSYSTFA